MVTLTHIYASLHVFSFFYSRNFSRYSMSPDPLTRASFTPRTAPVRISRRPHPLVVPPRPLSWTFVAFQMVRASPIFHCTPPRARSSRSLTSAHSCLIHSADSPRSYLTAPTPPRRASSGVKRHRKQQGRTQTFFPGLHLAVANLLA